MMTVTVECVCLEVLIDLGEIEVNRASPARAGHAGLGVNDDVGVNDPGVNRGGERQHCGGRIASGVADQ